MLLFIIGRIIDWVIGAYLTVLIIRMVLGWIAVLAPRWRPRGVAAALIDVVYRLTDPPLRWLRRYIPPIPLGPIYLDVSFIVLYFILIVLQILI
ncbi:YggT family protein [Bifidobacterium phasiani]|uniref:YggT family protein n=1 Tax=Bifidobacterium phasiani TaxID=2834431 RepID=A0ABS6WB13_9BIFI|nr:YggT family protein [Bifidobacterium phasiani]MBW3083703.1 YggT family protein [Bifidobacterium phasiani]